MCCTVLGRCRESLDCKCTVRNRFRKSWTVNVLYCAEQMQGEAGLQMFCAEQIQESWTAYVLYCAEQMQGKPGLQMYCAEQIHEKLDGYCTVLC